MKFSEHWLREWVNPPLTTQALADALTFGGIEVEALDPVAPAFEKIVVGAVLSVEKHPNADRLSVCQVDVGNGPVTIVCGAPNVAAGMKVPAALPGARLPGIEIKVAKVRGIESNGMLCSARELGLSEDASGLLSLAADAPVGQSVRTVLDLDDTLFTTKPTPNRGDCLSVLGMAREVSAICSVPFQSPDCSPVAVTADARWNVTVDATEACPLYCGRVVRGVNARATTPEWMVRRLERSGLRTISPVVDITNYVMLELGQPLHAFDLAKLQGGIRVRFANAGESLTLLNGEERKLTPELLVIADERGPLALAGIMGGAASGVGDDTSDVFLEAAFFAPEVVAGRSRTLGFGSDSSYRFERGVDFGATRTALERATRLLIEICGGAPGPVVEAAATLPGRAPVPLRLPRVKKVLGVDIPAAECRAILSRLSMQCAGEGAELRVTPPTWRFDIAREEDLVEELARVHGYERIPAATPAGRLAMLPKPEVQRGNTALRRILASRDYCEIVTYSFVDRAWEADLAANAAPVALANPIASQMSVMRSTLFGGLLDAVRFNLRHQQTRVRVFELGRCFTATPAGYDQPLHIGGAAYGGALPLQWGADDRAVDFYDVKADIEALLAPQIPLFEAAEHPALHPGKSARIRVDGVDIGWLGELHPRWQQKYDLPASVVLFELKISGLSHKPKPEYKEISRLPAVRRDIAAVFDEDVRLQAILDGLEARKPPIVSSITLFDVYRGKGLENGKKSLAFSVLLQDTQKTLTDAEVESAVAALKQVMQEQFNAKLR